MLILFAALLLVTHSLPISAQHKIKESRILILLDGSSSMLQPWDKNITRFQAASRIILQLMDSVYAINRDVEFGLRVYGHQSPAQDNNCYDTKQEVMFSKDNLTQMGLRLENLRPAGVSPISFSLQQAAEKDFVNTDKYNYSLILVTDGGESCNGNICKVTEELLNRKIDFKPYIISLVDYAPLKDQYACLGQYLLTNYPTAIVETIEIITTEYRKIIPAKTLSVKIKKERIQQNERIRENIVLLSSAKQRRIPNNAVSKKSFQLLPLEHFKISQDVPTGFGFVYFNNTNAIGEANLYLYSNGEYVHDRDMQLRGIQSEQKIKLQSGNYKITYSNNIEKKITIKNNMITELTL